MKYRWSLIAENLHGRTDNDVKNHWHSQLKRRLKGKQRNKSELKGRKGSISESNNKDDDDDDRQYMYSECEIMKVLDGFNNILESSSFSISTPAEDNSVSMEQESTVIDSPEDNSEQASCSWEPNKFREFSGDFWTEPFISENNLSEYCYDDYGSRISENIFSYYDVAELFYY